MARPSNEYFRTALVLVLLATALPSCRKSEQQP